MQPFPRPRKGDLPIWKGHAVLKVVVPAADVRVEDTIRIHSKLLDEEQSLKIVF